MNFWKPLIRQEPSRDFCVGVHATVAPERPVAAHVFNPIQVNLGDQHLFLVVRGLGDDLPKGIGDKRSAPEFQALARRFIAANVSRLEAHPVGDGDINSVSNGVCALDSAPRVVLRVPVLRLLGRVPANGRRIEKNIRALQRCKPSTLGIPLVPAHQRSKFAEIGFERLKSQIARREIELFVIQRVVRDVHLAVDANQFSAAVDHGRSVVINAGRTTLEQRSNNRDVQFAGGFAKALSCWAGNRLRQIEQRNVLSLAEILRQKEFGQADNLRAPAGGVANVRNRPLQILLRLRRAGHLHDANVKIALDQA